MATQTIIWTALPNGASGTGAARVLKLSVFVSPRLRAAASEGDRLGLFPDLLDWPARLQGASFKLQFSGGPTVDASFDKSKLDSTLWKALFGPTSFVRPYLFDNFQGRTIISYPVKGLHRFVRDTYSRSAGRVPEGWEGQFPGDNDSADPVIAWSVEWNAATEAAALANLGNPNPSDDQLRDRALLFHRRPAEPPVPLPASPQDHERTLDVHEAFTALGSYPELLRRLGLVIDLTVPASAVPLSTPGSAPTVSSHVAVLPTVPPAPGTVTRVNRSPRTACVVSADGFEARQLGAEFVNGLLLLDEANYELVPVDIDGATLKLVNAGVNLKKASELDQFGAGPPSLRSAGITLARTNEAARTQAGFARAQGNNTAVEAGQDVQLFAEDLTAGLRVDIFDESKGLWRSLNQRVGSYSFQGAGITRTIADEGFVEQAMSEAAVARGGGAGALYLHEGLARWSGWSAVAPMPGKAGGADAEAAPVEIENEALTQFKLAVRFTPADGSLPALRFGRRYRVRARRVDLAGNSVGLAEAPDLGFPAAPRVFAYLRYEPVPPPEVALRTSIDQANQPGETVTQVVLRTANSDPSKDGALSPASVERHLLPPRADATFAMTHGAIDDGNGRPRADLYPVLASRDGAQTPTDGPTGAPIDGAAQATLRALPDPLSRGPALRDLPGVAPGTTGRIDASGKLVFAPPDGSLHGFFAQQVVLLDWGGQPWPAGQPLRLLLRDGDGLPAWDGAARTLTIFVPKGRRARVPISSYLRDEDLKLMGVWEWLREATESEIDEVFAALGPFDPGNFANVAERLERAARVARTGGNVHLTPPRRIELIHAVQQPLGRPMWRKLAALRPSGATAVTFDGEAQLHRATTASVALHARWEETIDLPGEPAPRRRASDTVVVDLTLPGDGEGSVFDPLVDLAVTKGGPPLAQYDVVNDLLSFTGGATPRQQFGDTRHRVVRYSLAASSRFREFFPATQPGGFARASEEFPISIPSSTRPAPPRLAYALPTFAFTRQAAGNLMASLREGGTRVYLERPWFSSGDGELLAVVYARGPLNAERIERMGPFVTLAGGDPTLIGPRQEFSSLSSFEGTTVQELNLEGAPEAVDIDAVPVAFDAERKLWYADLAVFMGARRLAANPLIRLALARYQPNARQGRELSRVTLADFVQMPGERSAVVSFDPYDPAVVRLAVAGFTHSAKANALGGPLPDRTVVEVGVELRVPHVAGELGWTAAPPSLALVEPQIDNQGVATTAIWTGTIRLPPGRKKGDFRVVIREFERFIDDAAVAESGSGAPLRPGRLIYAEAFEV